MARFDEENWADHVSQKTWFVNRQDFSNALGRAKAPGDVGYIGWMRPPGPQGSQGRAGPSRCMFYT